MSFPAAICSLIILLAAYLTPFTPAQTTAAAPAPVYDACNGVFLSYAYIAGARIPPTDPANQAYRFESTLTILNNAAEELRSWQVFVGFQHDELLVSASGAVLADGNSLPSAVGNGTVFAGYPSTDLKSAIETAGDVTQMQVQVNLKGTQFGVKSPSVPMPSNISLVNDGFVCPKPTMLGTSLMQVCCTKDDKFKTNITVAEKFLPRQTGDLTIMYDVTKTYSTYYWTQVTIENHNSLGRLDNWKLSWDWMNDEFIYTMKGAYPSVVDSSSCIFGAPGTYYQDMDFSNVLSCEKRPTIVDLPPTRANDTTIGKIDYCCRNGSILPPNMDTSKSKSAFQMQIFKMPPDLNRSKLSPPQNWQINGTFNPDYQCSPPIRVSPSLFPDPSGLPNTIAVASWQIVCNITQPKGSRPKCCVSFSAYYNDSVIPCGTCACGCSSANTQRCSASAPAILLPPKALLIPFENRTSLALAWAALKHRSVPNPMPCADNCGVSINWHLYTDYTKGWSARITLFNWDETSLADWFAAVEFNRAAPGFEAMYSFNGTLLEGKNSTVFMQGLRGLNYLVAETNGANPSKDPKVPGKQQSVISFTKKRTPGVNVAGGDGFPTKVYFNGQECALPTFYPTNHGSKIENLRLLLPVLLASLVLVLMQR
ncbi:hypothetical protein SAY87_011917 [Trapa incisa]|uniref:COBRA C-terminal domain-containing protein n=1 Tax=Trapa incisa TaxID=236973 RepID=A0AAN7GMM3_9MYRT|nr:hypothetical protein SAY87_011917 [Trapa incisa]